MKESNWVVKYFGNHRIPKLVISVLVLVLHIIVQRSGVPGAFLTFPLAAAAILTVLLVIAASTILHDEAAEQKTKYEPVILPKEVLLRAFREPATWSLEIRINGETWLAEVCDDDRVLRQQNSKDSVLYFLEKKEADDSEAEAQTYSTFVDFSKAYRDLTRDVSEIEVLKSDGESPDNIRWERFQNLESEDQ